MSAKQRLIIVVLFFLLGATCLGAGLYFGAMYGGFLNSSAMISSNYKHHKDLYSCGVEGDVECFKDSFRSLASRNSYFARMAASEPLPEELKAEMKKISEWYETKSGGLGNP
ncbi:hypothetical protein CF392_13100 [Tamilnaduibacter salinus]|uniref:Uncharacterized protein n=1 Tax=Tamilnaduibacter salinus TaxID=1484056 RepID=A0A2A2I168_9GAMM|nr:hypothetical protein [Tamilnaduibacter salinus]PAV25036.1 hypothetical protein CF392_13100 [Tamilnaduibacter salinus]